jgi:hypothetical protein
MKKLFVPVAILILVGAVSVGAQLRVDLGVNMPAYFGYSSGGASTGAGSQQFVPFPNARLAYQFGGGLLDWGIGVRLFTFIIDSVLYPEAYVELNLDRFTFSLNLGGVAFLEIRLPGAGFTALGINNISGLQSVILPDLNVAFKVNDWLRLGGGVFTITPSFGNGGILSSFLFIGYVNAQFVHIFG